MDSIFIIINVYKLTLSIHILYTHIYKYNIYPLK